MAWRIFFGRSDGRKGQASPRPNPSRGRTMCSKSNGKLRSRPRRPAAAGSLESRTALITARDGCRLFASVAGEGDALFLIPGLGGLANFWNALVPLLQRRFKIVLMDHRGTGRSDRPEQSYSVELLARDAVDVLDHFGISRAHIVGHSTGGAIAQVLAIDHASRVDRLVLSGSWDQPDAAFR